MKNNILKNDLIIFLFLFFCMTSILHVQTSFAQQIPERFREIANMAAKMSQIAYHDPAYKSLENGLKKEGWNWEPPQKLPSGLNFTIFQRIKDGKREIIIAFAGTEIEDKRDLGTDALQMGLITPAQYKEALEVIKPFLEMKDGDKNMSFTVTGHSLGGGLAQLVSLATGIRAFVFNSAGLSEKTLKETGLFTNISHLKELASSTIINFRMEGDWVSSVLNEYGYKITMKLPSGNSKTQFKALGRHSMLSMIEAIQKNLVKSISNGNDLSKKESQKKVGGVLINPKIEYTSASNNSLNDSILKNRTSNDSLIWNYSPDEKK